MFARVLRTGARVLLLDEPSEGLAPVIVQRIRDIVLQVKERGTTVLLVEGAGIRGSALNGDLSHAAQDRSETRDVPQGRLGESPDLAPLAGGDARIMGVGDRAIITVDDAASRVRQRFSVAHELGHASRRF